MFRSRGRAVVFPQAEHARLAGALALAWGERPPLPFESFAAGVALHDRGYGQHDDDWLEDVPRERWLEIQRAGFAPRGVDPVVDLVVAMHVRRLVGDNAPGAEMEAELAALREAAGVTEAQAAAADRVTAFCDRIAVQFCLEEPSSGEHSGIAYELDGRGGIALDPWPLAVPRLTGLIFAYEADGYPGRLEPVVVPFAATP